MRDGTRFRARLPPGLSTGRVSRGSVLRARADGAFEPGEAVRHSAPVLLSQLGGGEAGLDQGHEGPAVARLEGELDREVEARAVRGARRSGGRCAGRRSSALLDVGPEPVQPALPRPAVVLDPPGRVLEARGAEAALARPADLGGDDEVDLLEDADVLLDAVERQPQGLGELADGGRSAAEALEDAAARRVREGEERAIEDLIMMHRSVHYIGGAHDLRQP